MGAFEFEASSLIRVGADRTLGLSRSSRHYAPRPRDDSALIVAIEVHLKDNPRHGFGLLFDQVSCPKGFGKTGLSPTRYAVAPSATSTSG